MVISETNKDKLKRLVGTIVRSKVEVIENMVKGYSTLNLMKDDVIKLLKKVIFI